MTDEERKLARKCLEDLLEAKDPEIYKDLASAAHIIASDLMMQWMNKRGINHCDRCPSTDQLLNVLGKYRCPDHAVPHNRKLEVV
jgi:hypothetical protein